MSQHPHFIWSDLFTGRKKNSDLTQILRENILFSTLSSRELKYLSNFVYERVFETGEQIFRHGDRGVGMYLIVSGRIAIKTLQRGEETHITELGKGSFLGELALVDPDHLRSAHAVVTEPSRLIGFFKPDLEGILQSNPAMGVKILYQLSTVLGRRLLETTQRITVLQNQGKMEQVRAKAV